MKNGRIHLRWAKLRPSATGFELVTGRAAVLALLLACCFICPGRAECVSVRFGDRAAKQVAITVDDCYNAGHVRAILDLCREHGIQVTFFVLGAALKTDDARLWQSVVEAGHEIGNHSYDHKTLTQLSARDVAEQLKLTQQRVDELLGYHYPIRVMRPPYGSTNYGLEIAVEKAGYLAVVQWDVSQTDADKAFLHVKNGSILLYHTNQKDVHCLQRLIPLLLEEGYACVTVSELLGLEAVDVSPPTSGHGALCF